MRESEALNRAITQHMIAMECGTDRYLSKHRGEGYGDTEDRPSQH